MRIIGTGVDIIECERIEEMIRQHGESFLKRVYTPAEVRYCRDRRRAVEHFAGRWAAKEAVLKALGTGWRKGIAFSDIEVSTDAAGAPYCTLRAVAADIADQKGIGAIQISISHCRAYAVAQAIAVDEEEE